MTDDVVERKFTQAKALTDDDRRFLRADRGFVIHHRRHR